MGKGQGRGYKKTGTNCEEGDFDSNKNTFKKKIAEIIQADKSAIQAAFTDKVNLLKEELTEIGVELSKFISHINLTEK